MSAVRKASPRVFGNYLSNMVDGVFELAFDDIGGLLFAGAVYLVLCVLWVVFLGIVSALSELVSRSGL
jgi:hypothetical protein